MLGSQTCELHLESAVTQPPSMDADEVWIWTKAHEDIVIKPAIERLENYTRVQDSLDKAPSVVHIIPRPPPTPPPISSSIPASTEPRYQAKSSRIGSFLGILSRHEDILEEQVTHTEQVLQRALNAVRNIRRQAMFEIDEMREELRSYDKDLAQMQEHPASTVCSQIAQTTTSASLDAAMKSPPQSLLSPTDTGKYTHTESAPAPAQNGAESEPKPRTDPNDHFKVHVPAAPSREPRRTSSASSAALSGNRGHKKAASNSESGKASSSGHTPASTSPSSATSENLLHQGLSEETSLRSSLAKDVPVAVPEQPATEPQDHVLRGSPCANDLGPTVDMVVEQTKHKQTSGNFSPSNQMPRGIKRKVVDITESGSRKCFCAERQQG